MRVYQFRHVGTDAASTLQLLLQYNDLHSQAKDARFKLKRRNPEAITAQWSTLRKKSGRVVPTEGLEPPHLAAHGPEPCASTNSATWALLLLTTYSALPPTSAIILAFAVLRQTNFRYPYVTQIAHSTDNQTLSSLPACCLPRKNEIIAEQFEMSKRRPKYFPGAAGTLGESGVLRYTMVTDVSIQPVSASMPATLSVIRTACREHCQKQL